jgi:hypothetical protein
VAGQSSRVALEALASLFFSTQRQHPPRLRPKGASFYPPHYRKYPVSYTPQPHHLPASLYPHNRVHLCSRFTVGLRPDGVLRHAHFPDQVPLRRANTIPITSCIKALDSRAPRLRVARSQRTTTSASPLLRLCFASTSPLSSSSKPTSPKPAHPHNVGLRNHNTDLFDPVSLRERTGPFFPHYKHLWVDDTNQTF